MFITFGDFTYNHNFISSIYYVDDTVIKIYYCGEFDYESYDDGYKEIHKFVKEGEFIKIPYRDGFAFINPRQITYIKKLKHETQICLIGGDEYDVATEDVNFDALHMENFITLPYLKNHYISLDKIVCISVMTGDKWIAFDNDYLVLPNTYNGKSIGNVLKQIKLSEIKNWEKDNV